MKLTNIFPILLYLSSCKPSKPLPASFSNFNHLSVTKKTCIISCVKCGCIIESMNDYFSKNKFDSATYKVYGDTTCLGGLIRSIKINHLSQKYIDSCSTDFYNMLVLTKQGNNVLQKEVTTKEAKKLSKFLDL